MRPRSFRVGLESFGVRQVPKSLLRVRFDLLVLTKDGWKPEEFRLDTGASLTTMSVARADQIGLAFPRNARSVPVETALGRVEQLRHLGELRVRVPGWDDREFRWPCHFLETDGPQPVTVLGLTGPLEDLTWKIDGAYAIEYPNGSFTMEEVVS